MALDRSVLAAQREVGSVVIEARLLPAFAVMTLFACRTQAAGMTVLRAMAAMTILRHRVLHAATRMAAGAIGAGVRTEQRKTSFACVIELLRAPLFGRVALAAVSATGALMRIVGCVTRDTLSRCAVVTIAEVTRRAGRVGVLAGEREVSPAVIECDVRPSDRVMAGSAVLA